MHPLFTVELLRGLQSRGELTKDESGRWIVESALNWKFLPPRVEAAIAERLGRLPKVWQDILIAASVEGEEFTAEVIARVKGIDKEQVLSWLSGPLSNKHHLVQAQELAWLGDQRLSFYRFRHFLFQKYLYDQLDPIQQTTLYQAVGLTLETLHGEETGKLAVTLARHFEKAGMTVKVVEYLLQAGDRAARLFANDEAIAHYRHGIELIETLENKPQRNQLELALQLALSVPLTATQGFSGEELAQTYGRARDLTRGVEASPKLFHILSGLKSYYDVRGGFQEAKEISEDLLCMAEDLGDPGLIALTHHQLSVILLYLGQLSGFVDHREKMIATYDSERDRSLVFQTVFDAQIANLNHTGLGYWFLGYPEQAKRSNEEAVNLAREWEHPFLLSFAIMFAACAAVLRRDVEAACSMGEETVVVAGEHDHLLWLGGRLACLGWALGERGELDEGIEQILRGQGIFKAIGAWMPYLNVLSMLAETYCKAGMNTEGLAVIKEAFALIEKAGGWMDEPEMFRLKGELLLLKDEADPEAEVCFRRAIELAQSQDAKSSELRAIMSLSRMLSEKDKQDQARNMLTEIYNWFTEGFEFPDLQDAKALLEDLS